MQAITSNTQMTEVGIEKWMRTNESKKSPMRNIFKKCGQGNTKIKI